MRILKGVSIGLPPAASLQSDSRITSEIERTLRGGADMPHIEYNKSKLEGYGLEIQKILATLNAPTSPLDENPDASEHVSHLAPVSPHSNTTALVLGSGTLLAPPSLILCGRLITPWPFPPLQLQHSSLWTFGQTRVHSGRTSLPDRGGLLE